ncbi:KIAA1143-like protein [Hypsibius exemplaris]|uniref:KIAA1143-like protein n=1 Tax=Hypsibius exemplaris TaxID=2072580 RepID=A0A9X6ND91_HYPEX|nr:KIAA1143-like protein [Hypsibius exemplaris]
MSKKNQISFTKPAEPSFLKQFKQRAGFKEGPTVEDKRRELPVDDGKQEDRPDERPQIISLKAGDLTEEEVAAIAERDSSLLPDELNLNAPLDKPSKESEYAPTTGTKSDDATTEVKMTFRKPDLKRPSTDDREKAPSKGDTTKKAKQASVMDNVRNKSLLSFGLDDEEE